MAQLTSMRDRMFPLVHLGWLLLIFFGAHSTAAAQGSAGRAYQALSDYFAAFGAVPVFVNRGYQVGDIILGDGSNIYARASRCFPALKPPTPVRISIPDVLRTEQAEAGVGLQLKRLFESQLGGDLDRRIEIRHSEVSVVSVPLRDLRDILDRAECPGVAPLVDGAVVQLQRNEVPFFVVSEVMTGRREARLLSMSRGSARAETAQAIKEVVGAGVEVAAASGGMITLKSEAAEPIALRPVTIPRIVTVQSFAGVRGEEVQLVWQPVECPERSKCWETFKPFADVILRQGSAR